MNCDEAFDLMTHPTDYTSNELQWHLQMCPRCRQMQETLAPALKSFYSLPDQDEPITEELELFEADFSHGTHERPDTGFSGADKPFLSPDAVRIAEQAATRLRAEAGINRPARQLSSVKRQRKRLMQAALILMVGLIMGWGISIDVPNNQLPLGASSLSGQQPCLWIAKRDGSLLQQGSMQSDKASVNSVVLSCVACHLQSSAD